jgi:hypothetical protein
MIRIWTATKPKTVTITVDGQLTREFVGTLDVSVKQANGHGRPIHLFLRDVTSIDEGGHGLLSRLAAKGVRLSASGIYSSYIVSRINRCAAQAGTHP